MFETPTPQFTPPAQRPDVEALLDALERRSAVYSRRFWPRAFAVWGHMLAATMLVYGIGLAFAAVYLVIAAAVAAR
jgi:hypothetical protein